MDWEIIHKIAFVIIGFELLSHSVKMFRNMRKTRDLMQPTGENAIGIGLIVVMTISGVLATYFGFADLIG